MWLKLIVLIVDSVLFDNCLFFFGLFKMLLICLVVLIVCCKVVIKLVMLFSGEIIWMVYIKKVIKFLIVNVFVCIKILL